MKKTVPVPRGLTSTVNFDADGKQHGHLILPYTSPRSAMAAAQLPVCLLKNGDGPSVAVLAGTHGDEFEGQIAIQQLASTLQTADVNGTLMLLPALNAPAVLAGTRCSPIDLLDLEHTYPGNSTGTLTERIAAAVLEQIVARADIVIELQSGGQSMLYTPVAAVHFNPADQANQALAEQSMIAFGAPGSARLLPAESNTLAAAAQGLGKAYLQTQLGGGATASASNTLVATAGCRNVLIQAGLLSAEFELRSTRMFEVANADCYIMSPLNGMLELCRDVGDDVYRGNALARVIQPGNTGVEPVLINANRNGVLLARHHRSLVQQGDCIAIIADEVQG